MAKVVERAHEKARAAEQHDAEGNLRADGDLAEALRTFGGGAGILAQRLGKIGTQEVEDRRDAEEQAGDQRNASVKSRTRISMRVEYGSCPGSELVIRRTSVVATTGASARPAAAPARPSNPPSTSNCEMMRLRFAPSA